jgi:hypothetical protein
MVMVVYLFPVVAVIRFDQNLAWAVLCTLAVFGVRFLSTAMIDPRFELSVYSTCPHHARWATSCVDLQNANVVALPKQLSDCAVFWRRVIRSGFELQSLKELVLSDDRFCHGVLCCELPRLGDFQCWLS